MNDAELLATLKAVNLTINKEVRYKTDLELFNKADFWTIVEKAGDCDDYAVTKRQRLIDLGVDHKLLRLAICKVSGEGHCVLTCDVGKITYVLDNNFNKLYTYKELLARDYVFLFRQSADGMVWHNVVESSRG